MFTGLYQFLIIENFSSVVTFIVGLFVFGVYSWQKRDKKINTARLVLSEVRNAELKVQKISEILERGGQDFPLVLPTNNWKEYSYLFASDLDQDELVELNSFYSICESVDEYVKRDNEYFWITTQNRAAIAQESLLEFVKQSFDEKNQKVDLDKLELMIKEVLLTYTNHGYSYSPRKTVDELKILVSQFSKITTTTTGSKLKELADDRK